MDLASLRLDEGSVEHGVNALCLVPFQELDNFLFDYCDEAVFAYFADEPAEEASCIRFLPDLIGHDRQASGRCRVFLSFLLGFGRLSCA